MRRYSAIDIPSDLGLRPTGVRRLPAVLRSLGLLDGLPTVEPPISVSVPPYDPRRESLSGIRNSEGIRQISAELADRVSEMLEVGYFPIVLGGDCSILIGAMLGLRRRGRYGLFFIDGHADFYSPWAEPNGEAASMELALLTGYGPPIITNLEERFPLLLEEDVVVFGFRDQSEAQHHGSPDVMATRAHTFPLVELHARGVSASASSGLEALRRNGIEGFWVHLDADVLNDQVMPAVDYRLEGGLWPEELEEALAVVLASPLAVGLSIAIYNPDLDDQAHSAGRVLAAAVRDALIAAT